MAISGRRAWLAGLGVVYGIAIVALAVLYLQLRRDIQELKRSAVRPAVPAAAQEPEPRADDLNGSLGLKVVAVKQDLRIGSCKLFIELANQTRALLSTVQIQIVVYDKGRNIISSETIAFNQIKQNARKVSEESLREVACHDIAFLDLQGIDTDIYGDEICEYNGLRHAGCLDHVVIDPSTVLPLKIRGK